MKLSLLFFTCMTFLSVAPALDVPFYLGTMTDQSKSFGIYVGSLNTETGKLQKLGFAVGAKNPNFLAISPDHSMIYAVQDTTIAAYRVQADGALVFVNEQPSGGGGPCHVALDQSGHYVFAANYGSGNIIGYAIKPDGSIGIGTALQQFTGSGPDPKRQKQSYAHSVYFDPQNKFLYACDLGADKVWIFSFDSSNGGIKPAQPAFAKVPPGGGPRHLAFSPDDKFVFVNNEMGLTVTSFSRNKETGELTEVETVKTLPDEAKTEGLTVSTAEIFVHPSGKWLYVSNRGYDTMSVFSIDEKGKLKLIQNTPAVVDFPRSFAIDPTGKWIIAAGQKDHRIVVLKIDETTGELSPTDQSTEVGAPVCVLFVPHPS